MLKGINSTFLALKCRHVRLLSGRIVFAYIPQEQRALIALETMKFIMKAEVEDFSKDNRSLRRRIFEMEHLTNNFLNNMRRVKKIKNSTFDPNISREGDLTQAYKALRQVGFQKQNIDQVLCAYNLGQGIYYDSSVWKQDRFNKTGVSPNTKMVLMPNVGTGKIFSKILDQIGTYVIAGEKGSGKSFAYLNYIHLAKFIIDYKIFLAQHSQITSSELFNQIVDKDLFMKVRQLFYFPLRYVKNQLQLDRIILHQTKFKSKDDIKLASGIRPQEQAKLQLLPKLKFYYEDMKIKTVCVADESNVYFSFLRSHLGNLFSIGKQAVSYSDLLDYARYNFDLMIYNSSQAVEGSQIKSWVAKIRKPDNTKFHDPFQHQIRSSTNFRFSYSQLLCSKQGHTHLYSILWDELCKQMPSYNLQRQSNIKAVFEKTFGLPSALKIQNQQLYDKINTQNKFIWWNNDVRHLDIISILKPQSIKQQPLQPLQNALSKSWTKANINRISEAFKQLKQLIEKYREKVFIDSVKNYFTKQSDKSKKSFRFALLYQLKSARLKLPFDQQKLQQIEIDFAQISKTFFSPEQLTVYKDQVDEFCELLGFGYEIKHQQKQQEQNQEQEQKQHENQEKKNLKLNQVVEKQNCLEEQNSLQLSKPQKKIKKNRIKHRFLLTLRSANQLTMSISEDLNQVIEINNSFLSKGSLTPDAGGKLYDMLYYQLFQNTSFSFCLLQYQQVFNDKSKNQINYWEKKFDIVKTICFEVEEKEKMTLSSQLLNHIQFALQNPNKSVLGFPVTKFPEKNTGQNLIRNYTYNDRNPIFDFIIMQVVEDQLIVHSIDNTVGQLDEKIRRFVSKQNHDSLVLQILDISMFTGLPVTWHHFLLAPQFKVKSFNRINHRQKFQLNFAKGEEYQIGQNTLQYGLFSPDKEHFVFPESEKIIQSSLKKSIDDLFRCLELSEKLKSKQTIPSNQEILEYKDLTESRRHK